MFALWLWQSLCDMIGAVWDERKDTMCAGINWELFGGRDHVLASYSVFSDWVAADK